MSSTSQVQLSRIDRIQRSLAALRSDPTEFYIRIAAGLREWPERGKTVRPYEVDPEWETKLHDYFALPQCALAPEFRTLWDDVLGDMIRKGIKTGPMSYVDWNDGDPGMVRAVYCLVRHLNANKVVETGVAHGVTSRFVLEALARN